MHQRAILWEKTGDDFEGQPKVSSPVTVKCRWEDSNRQAVSAEGAVIGLDAQVWCNTEIPVDSLMMQGDLTDLTGTGFVESDVDIFQVKTVRTTPSLNNRARMRQYGLVRFRGSLPASVS